MCASRTNTTKPPTLINVSTPLGCECTVLRKLSVCFSDNNINILNSILDVQRLSEQFSSDEISVICKWNVSNVQIYYQQLLQNVSINVVPNPIVIRYAGNRNFQLTLLYNTLYNVSITQPGICGQPNQTVFIKLNYSKH